MAGSSPFDRLGAADVLGGSILIVLVVAIAMRGLFPHAAPAAEVVTYFVIYGLVLVWLMWLGRRSGVVWSRLVGAEHAAGHWPLVGLAVPLIALTFAAIYGCILALGAVSPDLVDGILRREVDEPTVTGGWLAGKFTAEVLLAPLVEELTFRGLLFHIWARRIGPQRALLATSLLFGVLHLDVIGKSVAAVVIGLVYVRTRSLLIPIGIHALNNGLTYLPIPDAGDEAISLEAFQVTWYIGLVGLILALPPLWWTRRWWRPAPGWTMPYDVGESVAVDERAPSLGSAPDS